MNEYYAMGKIISQPQFNFLFNEKRVSIISFWMQLLDENKIELIAYDEMADEIYRHFEQNDTIMIKGKLRENGNNIKIEIMQIIRW